MQMQIAVVVFSGTGNHHRHGTQILQRRHNHIGRAAAAQNQYLFPIDSDTTVFYQRDEAEIIRIVPKEAAVGSADDGIDRADFLSGRGQRVQIGNHVFFVGNGHIDTGKVSILQKRSQLLRLFFKEIIGIIPQQSVNLRGVAVPQLPAQ